jgi:poly(ribitol-phosphate) beta-N-acetylglucosaminyltransferase
MKLSVVMPVFKVEQYLVKCLDSILDQGFATDELEVIIINDGSPDNSKEIARSYTAKHPNFILIDQENQGVSVARNAGLDIARGQYIAFIDPDDSIHTNSLKPILAVADRDDLDILYLHLDLHDEAGNFLSEMLACGEEGVVKDGISHPRRTFPATLYSRSAIGNLRFKPGILRGQDTVFNVMVQSKAKRVSYCDNLYYKYLQRETSSRQFVGTDRNFVSCLLAIETIAEFSKTNFPNPTNPEKEYFDAAILIFIQRTLEWNVLPHASKNNFDALKAKLRQLDLGYMIPLAASKFPMFDKSFNVFMAYRKLNGFYHGVLSKFAKK